VQAATSAANHAVRKHGGNEDREELPVAGDLGGVKIGEIGEGTPEVQRLVIARLLGLECRRGPLLPRLETRCIHRAGGKGDLPVPACLPLRQGRRVMESRDRS